MGAAIGQAVLQWLRIPGNPRRAGFAALIGYISTFAVIILLTLSAAGAAASNVWWAIHIVLLSALTLLIAMLGGPVAAIQTMTGQPHGYWENGVFIHTPRILASNNDPFPPLRTTRITTFSLGWITFCLLAIVTPAVNWPAYLVAIIAATATGWWGYGPAYHGIFTRIARMASIGIVITIGIYEWLLKLLPQTMGAASVGANNLDGAIANVLQGNGGINKIWFAAALAVLILILMLRRRTTGEESASRKITDIIPEPVLVIGMTFVAILVGLAIVANLLGNFINTFGHGPEGANAQPAMMTQASSVNKIGNNEWTITYNPREELDTGIVIPKGHKAIVTSHGTVACGSGINASPNGDGAIAPDIYPKPGASTNSLLARVGSSWKVVGSNGAITGNGKTLLLRINDPNGPIAEGAGTSDNSGNWTVNVIIQ